ncbi:MAG: hypothetical protein HC816_21825 [Leptolyngbyaceae cyanobacterium RM1_1_2]|nr:hypothetical protein [Leptolyngbyaceae cyanobacterium RM1_1_2]
MTTSEKKEFRVTFEGNSSSELTIAQAETYRLLSSLFKIKSCWSTWEIMGLLGLSDPRPVDSRIDRLAEKGWITLEVA